MSPIQLYGDRPVVLLTNDDGPPGAASPNIYSFCKTLQTRLGWDVRVVIPNTQKSWVGKAYAINDIITASYFYPLEPDGLTGEVTDEPRPLKEGETMEWVLLSGTPASCANIGLHILYPGEIDLVISGPNYGRNSSTAFALSSGTIGAALSGALSVPIPGPSDRPSLHTEHIPCIAVSYCVVTRPFTPRILELSANVAADVCKRLVDGWGEDEKLPKADGERERGLVQIYSVNVPMVEDVLERGMPVCWTKLWRNAYGNLFKATTLDKTSYDPGDVVAHPDEPTISEPPRNADPSTAGPAAAPPPSSSDPSEPPAPVWPRKFLFAPDKTHIMDPDMSLVPEGTDAWAFDKGYVSVTPLRAEYAGVEDGDWGFAGERDGKVVGPGSIWE
ncbi:5'/3'-nucleotidase SurE [Cryptococcus sp. DSM 104549]